MKEKKKIQKPEMEFIEFNTADVITTSGGMDGVLGQQTDPGYGEVTPISGGGGLGGGLGFGGNK